MHKSPSELSVRKGISLNSKNSNDLRSSFHCTISAYRRIILTDLTDVNKRKEPQKERHVYWLVTSEAIKTMI